MIVRRLLSCKSGSMAIEFAIVAPVFIMLLLGAMEYCRLIWTTQALNSVAFSTARCATYSTNCATTAAIQTYANQLGRAFGLSVPAASVTYATNASCNGNSAQNKVSIAYAFSSPLTGLIPMFPATVTGTGCFSAD